MYKVTYTTFKKREYSQIAETGWQLDKIIRDLLKVGYTLDRIRVELVQS